jgi:hypothetical protein
MKRTVRLEFDSCVECPYFEIYDGYSEHQYVCEKYSFVTPLLSGSPEDEEIFSSTLSNWFENLCHLDKVEQIYP